MCCFNVLQPSIMHKPYDNPPWQAWRLAALIVLVNIVFSLPALCGLEYLRHTEADRTLIGWEMSRRADYLIPHLLGDRYITKPPLFYWLLAAAFSIVGAPLEWAARLVSLLGASIFLGLHYLLLRKSAVPLSTALVSSIILGTNFAFFTSSTTAEIDMTFVVLCGLSIHLSFLSITADRGLLWALSSWAFAGLAFLTKGPPVLIFLGAPLVLFMILQMCRQTQATAGLFLVRNTARQLPGMLLFLCMIGTWIYLLQQHVPMADLKLYFDQEILQRFHSDPKAGMRSRGLFFYPLFLIGALMPWSLLALGYFRRTVPGRENARFLLYCLCAVIPAVLIFSLSSGKSGRYILPVTPFLSYLLAAGAGRIWSPDSRMFIRTVSVLTALLLLGRLGYAWIYAPLRNEKLSVKPAAAALNAAVPASEPVYILEMFERWLPYYLIRSGREVLRLTPSRVAETAANPAPGARLYILLNAESESWRTVEMKNLDPSARELARYQVHRKIFALWEIGPQYAVRLNLRRLFPDEISSPDRKDPGP